MARARSAEDSKRDILDAAENEFSEKGFFGARVDEIAERAGINKRMVYAYFGDKEELYKTVLSRVYARMENVEYELVKGGYQGIEMIEQIISTYFDFLRDNPSFVHILMWENLNRARYLQEIESSKIERHTLRVFADEISHGKDIGIFRADVDVEQTVVSLITICFANFSNQYTLSKLFDKNLMTDDAIASRKEHTIDMVLRYLCN